MMALVVGQCDGDRISSSLTTLLSSLAVLRVKVLPAQCTVIASPVHAT
jgi:hypothetical protein